MLPRRALLATPLLLAAAPAATPLRLGVLTTLSGPAADGAGRGSVEAARLALEDIPSVSAELLVADMGERPEQAAAQARRWFDEDGVAAVIDVPNSAAALAVATVARERDRAALFSGAGSSAISGAQCGPNHLQWTYTTTALARGGARAVLAEGGRDWFFLTADYAFGHALQADATREVLAAGGKVLGGAAFPAEAGDFSALLLQGAASGAGVIGLACTGEPFQTILKQAREFELERRGLRLAALLCLVTNVHAVGLPVAQGLLVASPFYWDLTPGSRAFAARLMPRNRGIAPTMTHAGVYAATRHLLRAVAAGVSTASGRALVAAMKRLPVDDQVFEASMIRWNGSVAHPMHLFRIKAPGESGGEWDLYRYLRTIPADVAFGSPAEAGCPEPR
jgi:branched-chain amino acid transport system substrate-binding protein